MMFMNVFLLPVHQKNPQTPHTSPESVIEKVHYAIILGFVQVVDCYLVYSMMTILSLLKAFASPGVSSLFFYVLCSLLGGI